MKKPDIKHHIVNSLKSNTGIHHITKYPSTSTLCGRKVFDWVVLDIPLEEGLFGPTGAQSCYCCKHCFSEFRLSEGTDNV